MNAQTRRLTKLGDLLLVHKIENPAFPYVCLFDLCVHPTSFAQTVENLFDLSFQVKNSDALVTLIDGVPHVTGFVDDEALESSQSQAHSQSHVASQQQVLLLHKVPVQCISSLTPKQWRTIVSQYNISEAPLVGDRDVA